jgi:hypothetical protein
LYREGGERGREGMKGLIKINRADGERGERAGEVVEGIVESLA